jgi:hypothetical protein
MSIRLENIETSNTPDLLLELQNSGKYLFHGSQNNLTTLEPHKPKGDMSSNEFNKTTGVYATLNAARAIISAVMPKESGIVWGTVQDNEGNIVLHCKKDVIEKAVPGFVYVLDITDDVQIDTKTSFPQFKFSNSREPVLVIPVSYDDYISLGGKVEIEN